MKIEGYFMYVPLRFGKGQPQFFESPNEDGSPSFCISLPFTKDGEARFTSELAKFRKKHGLSEFFRIKVSIESFED